MFNQKIKNLSFILSILVLVLVFGSFIFAWTEPTQPAPDANVDPPLTNVGAQEITQGSLTISGTGGEGYLSVSSNTNDKIILQGTQSDPHTILLKNSKGIRFYDNTNGELMRITADGKVGIGTASPRAKLNIYTASGNPAIAIGRSSNNYYRIGMAGWDSYIANNAFYDGSWNYINTAGYSGEATRIQNSWGKFSFSTANNAANPVSWNERMTILNNGKVGIGTTTPSKKFDVAGDINFSGSLFHDGTIVDISGGTNNYVNSISFNTGSGVLTLGRLGLSNLTKDLDGRYLTSETDPQVGSLTDGQWCTSDGTQVNCTSNAPGGISCSDCDTRFVNISGDTMTGNLTVNGSISSHYSTIGNLNTTSDIGQQMEYGDASYTTLRYDSDRWRLWAGGTGGGGEIFTVKQDGKVGIGTTSPNYDLDVSGSINASNSLCINEDCRTIWPSGGGISCSDCDARFVNISGDTMTGNLTVNGSISSHYSTIGNLNTTSDIGQQMEYGDASYTTLRYDSDRWRLWAGGTGGGGEIFTVKQDGKVGIGTATPSSKFEVNGNIELTNLYDNDISNFFDGSGTTSQTLTAIDSTGALTFTNIAIAASQVTSGEFNEARVRKLESADTRGTNPDPQNYSSSVQSDFKQNTTDSLADGGTYHGVISFRPYGSVTDFSGGPMHQLGFTQNGNTWMRTSGGATTWDSWYQIARDQMTNNFSFMGKVGIGTTTPGYTLDVAGNINFTGSLYQNGSPFDPGGTSYWTQSGSDIYYNNGNVGIGTGTASPGAQLEVRGYVRLASEKNANKIVRIGDPVGGYDDNVYPINLFGSNTSWGTTYMGIDSPNGVFNIYPINGANNGKFHELNISFKNSGSDTNTVDIRSTTSSQNTVLNVRGNDQGSGMIYVGQSITYGGGIAYDGDGTPAMVGDPDRITFFRRSTGADTEVFSYSYNNNNVRFNGNVGIGTTEPNYLLDIDSGESATSWLGVKTSGATALQGGLLLHQDSTYGWQAATQFTGGTSGDLVFDYRKISDGSVQTANVLVLQGDGKVGIGTATPSKKLDVAGDINFSGTLTINTGSNDKIILQGTQSEPHTILLKNSKGIRFYDDINGELMRITADGKVGIGTTKPQATLHVTGNLRVNDLYYGPAVQVGNTSIPNIGRPALAALSSTDVAFIDTNNDKLRTYRWSGSAWTQVGNSLSISGGNFALAALSSTEVAFIDYIDDELRTYRWDGNDWVQVGSSLYVDNIFNSALAALSSTDVALIDSGNDELRTYRWSGSAWTQVGNSLNIPGLNHPALAALNSTDVAFMDFSIDELRTYRWSGSAWTQVGNSLNIPGAGRPALAALSSTDVAYIDWSNDELRTYRWSGNDWVQVGNSLSISGISIPALAALSSTDVAFIDQGNDELRTYRWSLNLDKPYRPWE